QLPLRHLTPNWQRQKIYALAFLLHDREVSAARGGVVDNADIWGYIAFADHSPYDPTLLSESERMRIYRDCVKRGKFPPFWDSESQREDSNDES
ncbi:MAG: hypothetical protein ACE5Q6_17830, partial [Dehalococcoidia bacterium]